MTSTASAYGIDQRKSDASPRTTVLIADGEAVFRTGLRNVLGCLPDFEVVAEAGNRQETARLMRSSGARVMLIDIRLAQSLGLQPDRGRRDSPDFPKIVLMTGDPVTDGLDEALLSSASALVTKSMGPDLLRAVLRHVLAGGCAVAPETFGELLNDGMRRSQPQFSRSHHRVALLNESERHVLRLLGQGLENAQIAEELRLSRASVKTYVSRLLNKLHLDNRTQAALLANETGLVRSLAAAR
ncbi:LuxR C-terminal-related transcriptional regulator [Streptomyces sp. IBSNAI002]|uniref:LuxR C-terminal-related transcriptional regulator n=1 Tax=Streptomyces sp. IBSNAI002 TaxID=3457500 RepID=UPI003FCEEA03